MMNNTAIKATETATTIKVAHCPTRYNVLNACHESFAPVQSKSAILYVSGTRQVTEFRVDSQGFRLLVWVKAIDSETITLRSYRAAEPTAKGLWKALEIDCLSGHARLSDRAAVRGVGGNPKHRAESRATDDVSAVVNWLRRAEVWYEKMVGNQRKSLVRSNGLSQDEVSGGIEGAPIRHITRTMQAEIDSDEAVNRITGADVLPQHINFGCSKLWDSDGCIAVRGKRVSTASSGRTLIGKRDRIERLRATAEFQLGKAAEYAETDSDESDYYMALALETESKIASLRQQIAERMAAARAAKAAKREAKLTLSASAESALNDEASNVARVASLATKDEDDSEETLSL